MCGINITIRFDNMVMDYFSGWVHTHRSYIVRSEFLNNLFTIHLVNTLIYQFINQKIPNEHIPSSFPAPPHGRRDAPDAQCARNIR